MRGLEVFNGPFVSSSIDGLPCPLGRTLAPGHGRQGFHHAAVRADVRLIISAGKRRRRCVSLPADGAGTRDLLAHGFIHPFCPAIIRPGRAAPGDGPPARFG